MPIDPFTGETISVEQYNNRYIATAPHPLWVTERFVPYTPVPFDEANTEIKITKENITIESEDGSVELEFNNDTAMYYLYLNDQCVELTKDQVNKLKEFIELKE